jgi:hypothetical protein
MDAADQLHDDVHMAVTGDGQRIVAQAIRPNVDGSGLVEVADGDFDDVDTTAGPVGNAFVVLLQSTHHAAADRSQPNQSNAKCIHGALMCIDFYGQH